MSKPTAASKAIRDAMVSYAIAVVRAQCPGKTEEQYKLAESRLRTSIKRIHRGNKAEYTLSVPEVNLMLARTETLVRKPMTNNRKTAFQLRQRLMRVGQLRAEVKAAWIQACEAEGIPTDAKFVVFTNTTESALYNELAGMLLRELKALNEAGFETAVL